MPATRQPAAPSKSPDAPEASRPTKAPKASSKVPKDAPAPARTRRSASPATVRFRLRINVGDVIAVGPGKIALIEAIAQTGSITAAAKTLDMSYRRAWMLLDELNRSLRQPAVESAKGGMLGGGSALTETGQALVTLYRRIEHTAEQACRSDLDQVLKLLAR